MEIIRVAILDDHQSIIDGYVYRLSREPGLEVVATALFGDQLDAILASGPVDVLLLDVNVPASKENLNPYPLLHLLPKLIQQYPKLNILIISMMSQPALIKAVIEAGASGFILKDDQETIRELGSVVRSVAKGGIHLSRKAHQDLYRRLPMEKTIAPRQQEVLSLCAAFPDMTTAEIADKLGVANSTVRNLLSNVYLRLNVRSRAAAIAEAQRLGLLPPV
ncbi:MAG: response regulator transcription factor [Anaerolineales bacterium]